jgi:hypothetical protein
MNMNAPPSKWIKVWLVLLTFWQAMLSLFLLLPRTADDPKAMFTRWSGDRFDIGCVGNGEFVITHLRDVARHVYAELPKPIFVTSSGGVTFQASDLAKLTWIFPLDVHESAFPSATNAVASPPAIGTQIEAIYLFPARAPFKKQ